jgi:hypothetical protein
MSYTTACYRDNFTFNAVYLTFISNISLFEVFITLFLPSFPFWSFIGGLSPIYLYILFRLFNSWIFSGDPYNSLRSLVHLYFLLYCFLFLIVNISFSVSLYIMFVFFRLLTYNLFLRFLLYSFFTPLYCLTLISFLSEFLFFLSFLPFSFSHKEFSLML